jgi:hypothetical protein
MSTKTSDAIKFLAKVLTGHQGSEALNRLAKQLVCGAAKSKGFWDHSNDSLQDVYDRDWVVLGSFNVLTRFSFPTGYGSFSWDFAGGVSEGKALSGYASSKGRHSKWVGDGARKLWEELNITGVVLVGFDEEISFYYLTAEEFHALDKDRLLYKPDSPQLVQWAKNWDQLLFQPTFASLMGK